MKTRALKLKRLSAPGLPAALAHVDGPVFRLVDPPGVFDRDWDRMEHGALRLPPGEADVPLYWDHSHLDGGAAQRFPVGRAEILWVDGEPFMVPRFDLVDEVSRTAAAKVDAGTVTACSIGYLTLRAVPNGHGHEGKGEDVQEAELLEVSLTGIGSKRSAVRVKTMTTRQRKWKSADDVQAGLEQTSDDVSEMKAAVTALKGEVAELKALVTKMMEGGGPEPKGVGAEGDAAILKWFQGLNTGTGK